MAIQTCTTESGVDTLVQRCNSEDRGRFLLNTSRVTRRHSRVWKELPLAFRTTPELVSDWKFRRRKLGKWTRYAVLQHQIPDYKKERETHSFDTSKFLVQTLQHRTKCGSVVYTPRYIRSNEECRHPGTLDQPIGMDEK